MSETTDSLHFIEHHSEDDLDAGFPSKDITLPFST